MDYNLFQRLFRSSSIRILRKDNAPFIIYFLEKYFRGSGRTFVPFEELKILLRHELENLRELQDTSFLRSAEVYINEWVNENFLSRRIRSSEEFEEIIVEPSSELEKVFSWMEDLRSLEDREAVGTESRFFSVMSKLKEIVEESVSDPKEKIRQLESKRKDLDEQIQKLKEGEDVSTFPSERIRGQYLYARKEALTLLSDFRQVEGNFTEITKLIHKKYLEVVQKGEILQFALDGDEELLQSEQGRSFQAFWDFLRSEQSQENFENILNSLYSLKDILALDDGKFFRSFRRNVREAGSRVNGVVSRMSEQLKKSLVERTLRDNRKSKEIISEIKHLVLEAKIDLSEENFYSVEEMSVHLPMDRPLWKGDPVDTLRYIQVSRAEEEQISSDFLDSIRGINFEIYEKRIQTLLRSFPEVSLEKVLAEFSEDIGFESIVAYISIASRGEHHSLHDSETFLCFPSFAEDNQRAYRVPKGVYRVGKHG
ncbi:PF11855 family protein [Leptospira inadai serovar Lyme str. 10]|uniref:PF11855 family protein n=2 Tax=Leptospira inadai serovar Lyme TaxID=293084 RepID=V6HAE2_9LEPT|nr:DUF3375 family protein [Leptospira inadai]EQA36336.1 PF11855 family protein [Leptospira inadai serovar Lyme str. 10]PNV75485.1 DUF3375 domain-containing protein [Leptospira inadai serovar Lyme]